MKSLRVEQLYPERAHGPYDGLSLFGIEVIGHASGKERNPATRRSIGNDRSLGWQGLPVGDP
jgi:hypothetical protein